MLYPPPDYRSFMLLRPEVTMVPIHAIFRHHDGRTVAIPDAIGVQAWFDISVGMLRNHQNHGEFNEHVSFPEEIGHRLFDCDPMETLS